MNRFRLMLICVALALAVACHGETVPSTTTTPHVRAVIEQLVEAHGAGQTERIHRGVAQVAERWRSEDGAPDVFARFCKEQFVADPRELDRVFRRVQQVMEQIDGHLHEVRREILLPLDRETGPVLGVDHLFSGVDLAAHVDEDLFDSKVAFLALLNFPVHTLADRLEMGPRWDRETWARSRMMDRFADRVPADVSREITRAYTAADQYIAGYNIRMDRLVTPDGKRLFPDGLRLITHWGLRDELKSQYATEDGLARQRVIQRVMERIVRQEIPRDVIDNAELLWSPESNEVWRLDAERGKPGDRLDAEREPDTRYARLLGLFHAVRRADPCTPTAPTFIRRKFNNARQIPEDEVESLLSSVLSSEEFRLTAELIRHRLGRPLEPFDIWYDGFKTRSAYPEQELDRLVAERYPDVRAFQDDLPRMLEHLGFAPDKAAWLAQRIVVDPSRGVGHAMGAVRREDQAHLRTRFGAGGMDYKGFNIAVHELGHNVEQVLSLDGIDHWWLNGVPNTAFTEAFAYSFQERDLELLGLDPPGEAQKRLEALDALWGVAEISAVSLVDMKVWHWMYDNPETGPAELREATLSIARDVWNRYYAPIFGAEDQEILAVYSHMIVDGLYLSDYPIGRIVRFQLADNLHGPGFGAEFERLARQGLLTPDAWMRGAVGEPIATGALLAAAGEALER